MIFLSLKTVVKVESFHFLFQKKNGDFFSLSFKKGYENKKRISKNFCPPQIGHENKVFFSPFTLGPS